MILDNVNTEDLYPTEKKGPSVLGEIEYQIKDEVVAYKAAYIATNERLILNVDMDGKFYYRSIQYNEIEKMDLQSNILIFKFSTGTFIMKKIKKEHAEKLIKYINIFLK